MSDHSRIDRLRAALDHAQLDGIYLSSPVDDVTHRHSQNRRYLAGFTGSAGHLIVTQARAILAVDARYSRQARDETAGRGIQVLDVSGKAETWLPRFLAESSIGACRLGISRGDVSYGGYVTLAGAVEGLPPGERPELVPAPPLIEQLRAVKDPGERATIQRAIEIAQDAFDEVRGSLEAGMSEREFAVRLEQAMRARGARGHSFEPIVAGGERGAMPHATISDRPMGEGEPIVCDWGAEYEGYCSDITRTFWLGHEPGRFAEIYAVVAEAQQAAIDGIEAGISGAQAHELAASVIEKYGYGEHFTHGLGHGVGLAVHDYPPYLGPTSEDVLEEGMIFTVEPGIYIEGWGGVRIEDIVVMEHGRARRLSRPTRY